MDTIKYFPLGIASGEAFCNRVNERQKIIENIQAGRHTLVMSPRRYGKSSLVLNSLAESKVLFERVDLFVALDERTTEDLILAGVKRLINKISKTPEQIIRFMREYLKKLKTKFTINTDGVSIELVPDKENNSVSTIISSLQLLDHLLQKRNISAVFFIDEFQELGVLATSKSLEGAIRNVAQECQNLSFIFSGSNRNLLSKMFDSRSRPLYMLCDRIKLGRIHKEDYILLLNKLARKQWNKVLIPSVLDAIFECTQRHPYYMNVLCGMLWQKCKKHLPKYEDVMSLWQSYILQEETKTAKDLSGLSLLQKQLLITISQGVTKDLNGKVIVSKLNVTSAAITKALRVLVELDYVQKDVGNEYLLIDPLIKESLLIFYPAKR